MYKVKLSELKTMKTALIESNKLLTEVSNTIDDYNARFDVLDVISRNNEQIKILTEIYHI